MLNLLSTILRSMREREEGQTMAEYALILTLVVVVAAAALTPLGTAIAGAIGSVTGSL